MNLVDPPSLFKVSCPFNFGWYPFDKQVCNIRDKCASNYLGTFMNYKYTYLFKRNDNLLNTNNQARECAKHCRRAHRQRIGRENIPWYVPPYTWSYRFQYSVFWCNYQSFKKPRKKLSLFLRYPLSYRWIKRASVPPGVRQPDRRWEGHVLRGIWLLHRWDQCLDGQARHVLHLEHLRPIRRPGLCLNDQVTQGILDMKNLNFEKGIFQGKCIHFLNFNH